MEAVWYANKVSKRKSVSRIVRVNGDEGTPVPIPNTVVKLVYGDNTWLATAWEDNSTRTQNAGSFEPAFCFIQMRKNTTVKLSVQCNCYQSLDGGLLL